MGLWVGFMRRSALSANDMRWSAAVLAASLYDRKFDPVCANKSFVPHCDAQGRESLISSRLILFEVEHTCPCGIIDNH